jgi:aldehyde dehydrogenase (NAD+)
MVFSKNIDRALNIAHRLEAGTVCVCLDFLSGVTNCSELYGKINNVQTVEPGLPFGGYKASGWGRELGQYALEKYVSVFLVFLVVR